MELACYGKDESDTKVDNATWADVEAVLPELKEEAFFRLSIVPEPESGPALLEIQSEGGHYLPGMLVSGEPGGREFVNPDGVGKDMVSIGGYMWDPTTVTQDFDLILRMVKEFYETGDVSQEFLK